jgi:hypothetical protein
MSMTSRLDVLSGVLGAQEPRIHVVPEHVSSAGSEAIEVAEIAGLFLDPWEKLVLQGALAETAAGRWAAYRVGLEVPRQNGKGSVLEARELAGLAAFGERLIIHSAHEQATATEHFNRMLRLMEGAPEFDRRILKVVRGKGSEAILLRDGYRIFFKTRTGGGGRGFTGDLVVFDEAMMLAAAFMAALVPTMAARSMVGDPQLWFAGSAVDQQKTELGVEFARVRADALNDVERLAYFGWGAPFESPDQVPAEALQDPEMWAVANPGLGIRISPQYVADEQRALGAREFAVERLGVGDWPSLEGVESDAISKEMWTGCEDIESVVLNPVRFAFDVTPDRQTASIVAAGFRADGLPQVEVTDHRAGTRWIPERLEQLQRDHESGPVILDQRSPAAALIPALVEKGVRFEVIGGSEYAQACGLFFDDVAEARLRHLGTRELASAVLGAKKRPLGDAWAWSRKTSTVDISPLVAATLARFAVAGDGPSVYEDRGLLVV